MKTICFVMTFARKSMMANLLNRSKILSNEGYRVTVIAYVGNDLEYFKNSFLENNIEFIQITDINADISIQNEPYLVSYKVYHYLMQKKFDSIHFSDFMGSGFHSIQSKKNLGYFKDTSLVVDIYGPSQFINEANEDWGEGGFHQLLTQYMERYCCEYCDSISSYSQYLFNWADSRKWVLSASRETHRYFSLYQDFNIFSDNNPINSEHLIYIGEFGKLGGLHIFFNALLRLSDQEKSTIKKITFIGENGNIEEVDGKSYIANFMQSHLIDYHIFEPREISGVNKYMQMNKGIVIFPAIMPENSTYLFELAVGKMPLIVANVEANLEIVKNAQFFNPTPAALSKLISERSNLNYKDIEITYDSKNAMMQWINSFLDTAIDHSNKFDHISYPRVSICIAYYNHAKYLATSLKSLENIDYSDYEIIVVNDGSTDEQSIMEFNRLQSEYNTRGWKFINKYNEGPSIARNYAAAHATGEYLVFMDSDNIAKPNMLKDFVDGLQLSGNDCLTCYFDQFYGEGSDPLKAQGSTYTVLGPSLEMGPFMNCFGDTNFIIKKEVFEKIGGFYSSRVVTEDWQILAKLSLSGFKIDVIPKALFWYRVLPESNVSFGSEYYKQRLILQTYAEYLPPYAYHILNSLCRPTFVNQKGLSKYDIAYFNLKDKVRRLARKTPFIEKFISKMVNILVKR
ncbi:glycosyltransferase [Paenibacillus sedimenti]|uniref:Glycosyltransferase n=1 Tax=Paenibacillus sedimenti TaxID=2770274 RepID=A0A926QIU1_9BACL|nr:glycosyltransferase [Paenibacillus sedimenti]MBD0379692.1 glycosyltransferase [Paenibacillus sedimenti]